MSLLGFITRETRRSGPRERKEKGERSGFPRSLITWEADLVSDSVLPDRPRLCRWRRRMLMNFRDWISYRLGSSLLSARPFALSSPGADDGAAAEGDAHGALPLSFSLVIAVFNNGGVAHGYNKLSIFVLSEMPSCSLLVCCS